MILGSLSNSSICFLQVWGLGFHSMYWFHNVFFFLYGAWRIGIYKWSMVFMMTHLWGENIYIYSVYRSFSIYHFLSLPLSDNWCLKFKLVMLVGYVNCTEIFLFPSWMNRLHSAEVVWKPMRAVQAQVAKKKDVRCFRKCESFSFLHCAIPVDPRESGHAVDCWLVTVLNWIYSHFILFGSLLFCSVTCKGAGRSHPVPLNCLCWSILVKKL